MFSTMFVRSPQQKTTILAPFAQHIVPHCCTYTFRPSQNSSSLGISKLSILGLPQRAESCHKGTEVQRCVPSRHGVARLQVGVKIQPAQPDAFNDHCKWDITHAQQRKQEPEAKLGDQQLREDLCKHRSELAKPSCETRAANVGKPRASL